MVLKLLQGGDKLIVKGINSAPNKRQSKWIVECKKYENLMKWDKSYILPFCCTKETKLQTFHFKLLHTKMAITDYLYKREASLRKTSALSANKAQKA